MLNLPVIITPLRTYLYGQTSFWMEGICLQHFSIEYLEKQFFENCRREFHFCRREIDNATFASAFFCRREIIWVRKTESVYYGSETKFFIGPKIWELLPSNIKHSENLNIFRSNIKSWKPENCTCRF